MFKITTLMIQPSSISIGWSSLRDDEHRLSPAEVLRAAIAILEPGKPPCDCLCGVGFTVSIDATAPAGCDACKSMAAELRAVADKLDPVRADRGIYDASGTKGVRIEDAAETAWALGFSRMLFNGVAYDLKHDGITVSKIVRRQSCGSS